MCLAGAALARSHESRECTTQNRDCQSPRRFLGVQTCSRRCWACKLTAIWFWASGLTIVVVLLATLIVLGLEGY